MNVFSHFSSFDIADSYKVEARGMYSSNIKVEEAEIMEFRSKLALHCKTLQNTRDRNLDSVGVLAFSMNKVLYPS